MQHSEIEPAFYKKLLKEMESWQAEGLLTPDQKERILLTSAPVDPRDIFRGDYVTLSYNASTIDLDQFGISEKFKRNDTVYTMLGKAVLRDRF
jgi:uncharacterized membrane-anchored protein